METVEHSFGRRGAHGLIGVLAGISLWLLLVRLADTEFSDRLIGGAGVFGAVFFTSTLLMGGTLRFRLGASYAAGQALITTGLFLWASLRFVGFEDFLNSAHPIAALIALATLPLPFILAHETAPHGVRDYACLFDNAWTIFVKAATSLAFLGVFWLVLVLAWELFDLVGVTFLRDLLGIEWFSAGLSGGVLGLALGVLSDMRAVVVTLRWVALGLMRLLMPVVGVTSAIFILMVPVRGLDAVFASLSAAGTLMAVAVVAITLVTSVIDADDEQGSAARWMQWFAIGQIVTLPVISGIAVYAIWVRVAEYGWTRPRLFAALAAIVLLAYALGYLGALIARLRWCHWLRQVNSAMACALIALSALWLTPVLNAERITANSQARRMVDGQIEQGNFPARLFLEHLGKPGHRALLRLETHDFGDWRDEAIARAIKGEPAAQVTQTTPDPLSDLVPVVPAGQVWPDGLTQALSPTQKRRLRGACENPIAGDIGCLLVLAEMGGRNNVIGFLLTPDLGGTGLSVTEVRLSADSKVQASRASTVISGYTEGQISQVMRQAAKGQFTLVPASGQMLTIGDISFWPSP